MHWRAGVSAMWESKARSSNSTSYFLSPFSTLPLASCPQYLFLYWISLSILTLPHPLSPAPEALSLFLVSLCLFPPALCPQRARQPVSGTGWRGASPHRGVLRIAGAFCSPPWHLGAAGEPYGNLAFSFCFICVDLVIMNRFQFLIFRDCFLDV